MTENNNDQSFLSKYNKKLGGGCVMFIVGCIGIAIAATSLLHDRTANQEDNIVQENQVHLLETIASKSAQIIIEPEGPKTTELYNELKQLLSTQEALNNIGNDSIEQQVSLTSIPTTPTLKPSPTIFLPPNFTDNFNKGISPDWDTSPDEWATVDGRLVSLKDGSTMYIGNDNWSNYTVSLSFITSRSYHHVCDLILMSSSRGTEVRLRLRSGDYTWIKDGSTMPNTGGKLSNPYTVKVVIEGESFSLFINGQLEKEIYIGERTHGKVGISCRDYGVALDNFSIEPTK